MPFNKTKANIGWNLGPDRQIFLSTFASACAISIIVNIAIRYKLNNIILSLIIIIIHLLMVISYAYCAYKDPGYIVEE